MPDRNPSSGQDNAWLMKPLAKANVPELQGFFLILQICELIPGLEAMPRKRDDLVRAIEKGRAAHWDSLQDRPRTLRPTQRPGTLTATECNEFLATLPPWPLYGEGNDA